MVLGWLFVFVTVCASNMITNILMFEMKSDKLTQAHTQNKKEPLNKKNVCQIINYTHMQTQSHARVRTLLITKKTLNYTWTKWNKSLRLQEFEWNRKLLSGDFFLFSFFVFFFIEILGQFLMQYAVNLFYFWFLIFFSCY